MKINEIKNGNMNKVYLLENDCDKYIIRSSNFDNSFECKVLRLLSKNDFSCPSIITNFRLKDKYIMLYKYLDGNNPYVFDDAFFINLSQLLKQLHSFDHNFKYDDYSTNEENKDKFLKYYNIALKSKYLSNHKKLIYKLYNDTSKVDFDKLDKCIIHSDIKKENLVQNQEKLFLIDFGNCYVGSRLIDIIRVIMWFFIKNQDYNYNRIMIFINSYFDQKRMTNQEKEYINDLLIYCILYNLLKDICLYEEKVLSAEYIENNSINWLKALYEKEKVLKIGELIKNA